MIKINLLPAHILEGRRVKLVIAAMVVFVLAVTALLSAYVWAPAPGSLTSKLKDRQETRAEVTAKADAVRALDQQIAQVKAEYAAKSSWVNWVEEADRRPAQWIRFYRTLTDYIPSEVVLSSLPVPSGANMQLSGYTSDLRAATRWYLNMLRCKMLDPASPLPVQFNTQTVGWPGELQPGANPRMGTAVSMQVALNPQYLDFWTLTPSAPAGVGGPTARGGGGRGARMGGGGGRGGGGGGRGGGGGGRGGRGGGGGGPGGRGMGG